MDLHVKLLIPRTGHVESRPAVETWTRTKAVEGYPSRNFISCYLPDFTRRNRRCLCLFVDGFLGSE
jgi:hypothetical protein